MKEYLFKMKNYLIIMLFLIASIPTNAQQKVKNEKLEGNWYLDFQYSVICGRFFMNFETDGDNFTAYSRKNADKDILGVGTSSLGRAFSKKYKNNFKNGTLLRIVEGKHKIENDTLKLSGIFTSAIGKFGDFNGYVIENDLYVTFVNELGEQVGMIKGSKNTFQPPLEDYPDLFKASVRLTEEKVFNKNVLQTRKWKKFERNMTKVSDKVQDDMEMVFAFLYYARKSPISHYMLFKSLEQENDTTIVDDNKYVFLEEKSPQTAYIKITSFASTAAEMDSVFQIIIQNDYQNLIVDLRNNPGGNIEAALSFATSVVDTTFYGGVFLTQKWFNKHNKPPTVENYPDFSHFTEANNDLILEGIHNTTGLCLKIVPKPEVYKGNIYILTNKRTGSACEPVVYGFKQHKRATIIGEKTAGAMLNGEYFELERGFGMFIPTADYYASDGFRIDQKGVKPNIKVKQEKALDYVMKKLIK
jgi:hypothetical protein